MELSKEEKMAFSLFSKYQEEVATKKKKHESIRDEICDYSMGLAGESGEVIDLIKKIAWQGKPLDKEKIKDELGDILWYLTALAHSLDITLDDIAQHNVSKLRERYPSGFTKADSEGRKEYKNG